MITLSNITMQYGDKILYDKVSLTLKPGEKIGLVGANGSGKTTLFNIISRKIRPDKGDMTLTKNFRVGILEQEFSPDQNKTVLEEVNSYAVSLEKQIDELKHEISFNSNSPQLPALLSKYKILEHEFIVIGGYEAEYRAKEVLGGLGFTNEMFNRPCGKLSGGQRMRIGIARLLLEPYDAILLDEPTNHLDLPSLLWFEQFLQNYPGLVVMISHDRILLNKVVRKIIEISRQSLTVYDGNYDYYEQQKALLENKHESTIKRLEKERQKTERFIERFRAKNTKATQVQSRVKRLEKESPLEHLRQEKVIDFEFPQPERSGHEVVRLSKISKKYGENTVLDNFSVQITRGEKIAVTGKNGVGKSTLVKIMAGILSPDSGDKKIGVKVEVGYFSQIHIEQLESSNTIMDEMLKVRGERTPTDVRKVLGRFFFTGDDVDKTIGLLSGGEKSRL
ncbi:ABC-F family ATP-binding cassette domain-containing protein, partial [bacterium]|nr:ABC-F family ATP-binding cassette domain-containing protein [bacterium]